MQQVNYMIIAIIEIIADDFHMKIFPPYFQTSVFNHLTLMFKSERSFVMQGFILNALFLQVFIF